MATQKKPKKHVKARQGRAEILWNRVRSSKKLKPLAFVAAFAAMGSYIIFSQAATNSPPAGGYFQTLQPGSALPTDEQCAARVNRSTWEPRPENTVANQTLPGSFYLPGFVRNDGGVDDRSRAYADRVTGNFKGTTDEIIQWASCKWGFTDEIVRAVAVAESTWYQSALGDYTSDPAKCQVGYTIPCPESFGLQQVKATSHRGTFPQSRDSTAFNVDYTLMTRRVCYEGWVTWLYDIGSASYQAGDEWGCVGLHYSGRWYDAGANNYIATVKNHFTSKPWLGWLDSSMVNNAANIARGKNVTTSALWSENLQKITDGVVTSDQYATMAEGSQWAQIDLGQSYDIGRIRLWHYYNGGRIYRDVIVQTSSTPDFSSNVYTVFNNDTDNSSGQGLGTDSEYAEVGAGKDLNFSTIAGMRYVRFWSNGSTANAGNHIVEAEVYEPSAPTDTSPPTAPTNLLVNAVSTSQINLSWSASTDNVGVTSYDVYRNNYIVGTVSTTSYSDTGLSAGTVYNYHVKARDAAGNSSAISTTSSATTQAVITNPTDTTAPAVTISSPSSGSIINNNVSVKATATDNVAVAKMEVYIDGSRKATSATGSINYGWNARKAARGSHTITVKAYDAAGNAGQSSVTVYR